MARSIGQVTDCPADRRHAPGLQQQRFRIRGWVRTAVVLFVKQIGQRVRAPAIPVPGGVPNDAEEPGAAITTRESPKVSKRAQRRFLHNVLGVLVVSHEPARQTMRGVEMGQHHLVKARTVQRGGPRKRRASGPLRWRDARRCFFVASHVVSVKGRRSWHDPQRSYSARTPPVRWRGKIRQA